MNIGERIRARRKELCMTQPDLAFVAGYKDISTLSRIENNLVDPPVSRIEAIAKALQISPAKLCGWV